MKTKIFFTLLGLLWMQQSPLSAQSISCALSVGTGCNAPVTCTATGGTPPYTYHWSDYSGTTITTTNVLPNNPGGGVSVLVYDANNDTCNNWVNTLAPFQIATSTTPDQCATGNGTITTTIVGGTAPYSYLWNSGQTTANLTNLSVGTYSVTVTDALGCYSVRHTNIAYFSPISVTSSITPVTCGNNGALTLTITNGTPPYSVVWNTTPVSTGTSLSGLTAGIYRYSILDAAGCIKEGSVNVTGANAFAINFSHTPETCFNNNGSITATPAGGTAPFTYDWSNGSTTQTISGLSRARYYVTVTDALGCQGVAYRDLPRSIPFNATHTRTQPTACSPNGSATISLSGTPSLPVTYTWNTGATTSSVTGLGYQGYAWQVVDAAGCMDQGDFEFIRPSNCFSHLQGSAYYDGNLNCSFNWGLDQMFSTAIIQVNGNTMAFQNGLFDYTTTSPGTFTVSHIPPVNFTNYCPVGGTQTATLTGLGQTLTGVDFADDVIPGIFDLTVSGTNGPARPGMIYQVIISYGNAANLQPGANPKVVYDNTLTLMSSSLIPTSFSPTTQTIDWAMSLLPAQQGTITLRFLVPTTALPGSLISCIATIDPQAGDATPINNSTIVTRTVTAAYDPNEKVVIPAGPIAPTDSLLQYTVHFQNTGNDTAFVVEIRDTLDANLDLTTFRFLGASHANYNWGVDTNRVLTVRWNNIQLPDSHISEPASHGMFFYEIEIERNLPSGTVIENSASIYFDFNAPIKTNTTETTILITGMADPAPAISLGLYPNPATGRVTLYMEGQEPGSMDIQVTDLSGKVHLQQSVQALSNTEEVDLNVQALSRGVYCVTLQQGGHRITRKLVLQ